MPSHPLIFIDNYDSFTYNLVQYFQMLGKDPLVFRNHTPLDTIQQLSPSALVIGPGPGDPAGAGYSKALMLYFAGKIPILGVCLGHQCLGEIYGGSTVRALRPMHGKQSSILHNGQGLFRDIPSPFNVIRYHSLVVERATLPSCLEITAETEEGEIMGLRHRLHKNLQSVQFHPESVLSEHGLPLLRNFLA